MNGGGLIDDVLEIDGIRFWSATDQADAEEKARRRLSLS